MSMPMPTRTNLAGSNDGMGRLCFCRAGTLAACRVPRPMWQVTFPEINHAFENP